MTIITTHGYSFGIDAQGFGRHEADATRGIDVIKTELRKLDAIAIEQLHAADLAFQAADILDRPAVLLDIESAGDIEATLDWHDPSATASRPSMPTCSPL